MVYIAMVYIAIYNYKQLDNAKYYKDTNGLKV